MHYMEKIGIVAVQFVFTVNGTAACVWSQVIQLFYFSVLYYCDYCVVIMALLWKQNKMNKMHNSVVSTFN